MKKKISLLLAAVLVFGCLFGCGGTAVSSAEPSAASETNQVAEVPEETTAAEPETTEEASQEEAVVIEEPENYYVADETSKVSILYKFVNFFVNYWEDSTWESSPWWDALEEATNTEIELTLLSQDVFNEQALLLVNSGALPDVVPEMGNIYPAGISGAVNDEVICDLSDYIEEYAPHYYHYLKTYGGDTIRDCVMDGGAIGAMYALYNEPEAIGSGMWIREDWLNELKMDIPSTLEELADVLAAFKSEYNALAPMYSMVGRNTIAVEMVGVDTAFGTPLGFYTEDGEVHCNYIEDNYREYVQYLKDLAEDGLFVSSDVTSYQQNELMALGSIGVYDEKTENIADQIASIGDDSVSYKAMAAPGEPSECGPSDSMAHQFYISISTNCANPELVVKMFDYLFTEEGSMLASYGIEDISYEYVDGDPRWTEIVTNNPDGAPFAGTSTYYLNPGFPALQIANISAKNYTTDYQKEAAEIWASGFSGNSKQELNVSLDTEEATAINNSLSDMNTYLTQTVYEWIFGGFALDDAAWEKYLDTMDSMNIQEILDTYQAAYDRYLERAL